MCPSPTITFIIARLPRMEAAPSPPRGPAERHSIRPGELFVPDEVVHHCGFHCNGGGGEVVEVHHALDQEERGELHSDSDTTDKVELAPADERRRGSADSTGAVCESPCHCGILSSR